MTTHQNTSTLPHPAPDPGHTPRHLGIVLDGNRRWARARGLASAADGHRAGFGKIPDVLTWCEEFGVEVVTLWMLSDDNIARRSAAELADLYVINEDIVGILATTGRRRLHHIGDPALLPDRLAAVLHAAQRATGDSKGMLVNLAIGYGGHQDILGAVAQMARDLAQGRIDRVTARDLADRLSTAGQPDPDLIIRPSGEQRTSGFLLWQAARAEWYFCPRLWPDVTREDLAAAITAYSCRHRRLGA